MLKSVKPPSRVFSSLCGFVDIASGQVVNSASIVRALYLFHNHTHSGRSYFGEDYYGTANLI
jgi:hypothetical protein